VTEKDCFKTVAQKDVIIFRLSFAIFHLPLKKRMCVDFPNDKWKMANDKRKISLHGLPRQCGKARWGGD
jgi:hypothetical protein